jgi:TolB-like protein
MSGDREQEYFADGIVEDITTALSRIRWLFVVARNSSFTYKGHAVDVKQAGRNLGVRYVLEGSVRKAGDRIRITGQLIDALTGSHLWAERYDRDISDIFAVQDEIAGSVAAIIKAALAVAEQERLSARPLAPAQIPTGGEQGRVGFLQASHCARSPFRARPLWVCAGSPMGYMALFEPPLRGGSRNRAWRSANRFIAR